MAVVRKLWNWTFDHFSGALGAFGMVCVASFSAVRSAWLPVWVAAAICGISLLGLLAYIGLRSAWRRMRPDAQPIDRAARIRARRERYSGTGSE